MEAGEEQVQVRLCLTLKSLGGRFVLAERQSQSTAPRCTDSAEVLRWHLFSGTK